MASAREQAIQHWNLPKHPEYGTLARRTRTFYQGPVRWDPEGKPSVGPMAAAGFYYDGVFQLLLLFKFQTSNLPPQLSVTLRHGTLCSTSISTLFLTTREIIIQISRTYLNFKLQISRLSYPRHSVTELYTLLVLVPQLPPTDGVHVHSSPAKLFYLSHSRVGRWLFVFSLCRSIISMERI